MYFVSFASSLGLSRISLSTCVASCLLIYPCTFGVCWSSALCWCESGSSRLVHRHPSNTWSPSSPFAAAAEVVTQAKSRRTRGTSHVENEISIWTGSTGCTMYMHT
jgi:hypothetical protein